MVCSNLLSAVWYGKTNDVNKVALNDSDVKEASPVDNSLLRRLLVLLCWWRRWLLALAFHFFFAFALLFQPAGVQMKK